MPSGTAAFATGINGAGQAASFSQSAGGAPTQALTYSLASLGLTSHAFTVSFWMYATSLAVEQDALTLTSADGRSAMLGVGVHSSFLIDYQSVKDPAYREVAMQAGEWTMFTLCVQELSAAAAPSLNYVVYKNGVSQTSLTFNEGSTRTFSSLAVGGTGSAFSGRVDDVRLYSATLTAAQVASLYSATKRG